MGAFVSLVADLTTFGVLAIGTLKFLKTFEGQSPFSGLAFLFVLAFCVVLVIEEGIDMATSFEAWIGETGWMD